MNDAPVLAMPLLDQVGSPGTAFTFTVPLGTFTDVDSALTFGATLADGSPLPAWLSFDPLTRTFTGTPPAGFGGVSLLVQASDGISTVAGGFRLIPPPAHSSETVITASQLGGETGNAPAVGTSPLPDLGLGPSGAGFPDLPLGQPVDPSVGPSSINPNQRDGGLGGFPDLNALPPTAAGPDLAGFPVVRITAEDAGTQVRDAGSFAAGHRLFVFHGIPTMLLDSDSVGRLRVPEDAFAHTDPAAVVHLEARLSDGRPLPAWLRFEGMRGTFHGVPPEGLSGALEIEVIARDTEGREARTRFVLLVENLRADLPDATVLPEASDLALGLDVDAKEREKLKQRQEAAKRAGPPAGERDAKVVPATSFSDQVRAAKAARDPLLDKIVPPEKGRPTPPR